MRSSGDVFVGDASTNCGPHQAASTLRLPLPLPWAAGPPELPTHLSLPIILHFGKVLSEVLQGGPHFWVLRIGKVDELFDQLVGLVTQPGCLAGVGGQQ